MQDSDDPCDDVTADNLTGWTKRNSSRKTNSEQDKKVTLN